MLEQLKYKNHRNEVFEFGKDGIFVNTNELHDYEWEVTTKNNRIASLDHVVKEKALPVVIICEDEDQGIQARNKLFEVVEKDVLALQHGRIIIGDYYFKCYVTKSTKENYLTSKRLMQLELTLTSDFPFWVKETVVSFSSGQIQEGDSEYLDYNFDHPFDYLTAFDVRELNNTGFVGANFRLTVYGACSNPTVYIGGHAYRVNCDIEAGEYLTIDSSTKKITLTAIDGTVTNMFNQRNRDSYIFQRIPAGLNTVSWEGDIRFDVVILEERSEPKWT